MNWQTYPVAITNNVGSMVTLPFANFAHLTTANVVFAPQKTVFFDPMGGLAVYIGDWSNARTAQWHIDNQVDVVARKVTPSIASRVTASLPEGIIIEGDIGAMLKLPYSAFGGTEDDTFMPGGTLLFDEAGSVALYIGDGQTPRTPKWHVDTESDIVVQIKALASAGVTDHAQLDNLEYANSGHTGFASQAGLEAESQARHEEITTAINTEAEDRQTEDKRLNDEIIETNRVLSGKVTQTLQSIKLNKAINGETAVGKETLSQDIPLIAGGSWVNDADGTLAIYAGDLNPNTAIFRTKTTVGTGTEATDHAGLSNLDYNNSGHTGFASAEDMEAVTVKLDGTAKIMELDVTTTHAPPALPRTNGWRIGATGQGQTWWFSELMDFMQTGKEITPFPTDDTFFSILEIGVQSLMTMIGDTFQLKTENKDLVGAVNELNDRIPMPPSSGNFTLTAVDGVLQWEEM